MSQNGKTLADLCTMIVDCEHKTAPLQETGYPSIRTPNIGPGYLILDGVNRVSKATYDAWTKRAIPQAGDLILAREAPVGNVAVIPAQFECCLGQRTVLIRPNHEQVDSYYLCFLLLTNVMQAQLLGKSGGATVHHINMRDIRGLQIPELPPLAMQRKLANAIKAYDDLIETNRRRIALLEESARLLYREWFVDFRIQGVHITKTAGGLPIGWKLSKLSDIAAINRASLGNNSPFLDISYIDIAAVERGHIRGGATMPLTSAPGRARRLVQHGDVIWSCVRPNRQSYALLWQPEANVVVSTGFAVLSAKKVPFSYLYLATTTDGFTAYLESKATGAAYPAVTSKDFEAAQIALPPTSILASFHANCVPIFEMINALQLQNAQLAQARDELLPKLMSGELRL